MLGALRPARSKQNKCRAASLFTLCVAAESKPQLLHTRQASPTQQSRLPCRIRLGCREALQGSQGHAAAVPNPPGGLRLQTQKNKPAQQGRMTDVRRGQLGSCCSSGRLTRGGGAAARAGAGTCRGASAAGASRGYCGGGGLSSGGGVSSRRCCTGDRIGNAGGLGGGRRRGGSLGSLQQ